MMADAAFRAEGVRAHRRIVHERGPASAYGPARLRLDDDMPVRAQPDVDEDVIFDCAPPTRRRPARLRLDDDMPVRAQPDVDEDVIFDCAPPTRRRPRDGHACRWNLETLVTGVIVTRTTSRPRDVKRWEVAPLVAPHYAALRRIAAEPREALISMSAGCRGGFRDAARDVDPRAASSRDRCPRDRRGGHARCSGGIIDLSRSCSNSRNAIWRLSSDRLGRVLDYAVMSGGMAVQTCYAHRGARRATRRRPADGGHHSGDLRQRGVQGTVDGPLLKEKPTTPSLGEVSKLEATDAGRCNLRYFGTDFVDTRPMRSRSTCLRGTRRSMRRGLYGDPLAERSYDMDQCAVIEVRPRTFANVLHRGLSIGGAQRYLDRLINIFIKGQLDDVATFTSSRPRRREGVGRAASLQGGSFFALSVVYFNFLPCGGGPVRASEHGCKWAGSPVAWLEDLCGRELCATGTICALTRGILAVETGDQMVKSFIHPRMTIQWGRFQWCRMLATMVMYWICGCEPSRGADGDCRRWIRRARRSDNAANARLKAARGNRAHAVHPRCQRRRATTAAAIAVMMLASEGIGAMTRPTSHGPTGAMPRPHSRAGGDWVPHSAAAIPRSAGANLGTHHRPHEGRRAKGLHLASMSWATRQWRTRLRECARVRRGRSAACESRRPTTCRRVGEARNPGPMAAETAANQDPFDMRVVENMAAAAQECHTTWLRWSGLIRARAQARVHGDDLEAANRLVNAAATRARDAAVGLAQARSCWDRVRLQSTSERHDVRHAQGRDGRSSGIKGSKPREDDQGEDHGDSETVSDLRARLRRITVAVQGIVASGRQGQGCMEELRRLVQETADAIVQGRAAARSSGDDGRIGRGERTAEQREQVRYSWADARTVAGTPVTPAADMTTRCEDEGPPQAALAAHRVGRRHRRGSGATTRPEVLRIFFANTSSFSDKAEQYVAGVTADIWIIAETHLAGAKLEDAVRRVGATGRQVSFSEAALSETSEGGTLGGVMAGAKKHLSTQPLVYDTRQFGGYRSRRQDLVGVNVGLRGSELLVFGGYARGGQYLAQLAEVARVTNGGRLPFVWMADWNVPPDTLEAEPALASLDAVVLRPRGGTVSCHQGSGSLIDYAVVSRAALPYVHLELERRVPWSPHDGLRLSVRKAANTVKVQRHRRPAAWSTVQDTECSGQGQALSWDEAIAQANADIATVDLAKDASLSPQRRLMEEVGALPQALEIGRDLLVWSRAVELQSMASRGLDPSSQAARRVSGRARPPKIVVMPLMCSRLGGAQRMPGGYSEAARLWGTLRSIAARLKAAIQAGHHGRQDACRLELIAVTCGWRKGARRCWREIENGVDDAAGRLAVAAACAPGVTVEELVAKMETLERLEAEAVQQGKARANELWHKWVARALMGGAGAAHRWANAPNSPSFDLAVPGLSQPSDVAAHHTNKWSEVWHAGDEDGCNRAVAAAKEVRRLALLDRARRSAQPRTFSAEAIKEAANAFRRNTAIGSDGQEFSAIAQASEEARAALGSLAQRTVQHLAWPVQALLTIMRLLGKKQGGSRAIAIISSFARLVLRLTKEEVRQWDLAAGSDDDTALAGRRPLDETARRVMRTEVAGLTGRQAVLLLWDMANFFDTLDPSVLADAAVGAGFPLDQLALGLILHRGPRFLRVDGCDGDVIERTGRSVLPGCTMSTSFARAYLKPLRDACGTDPLCRLSQHVDDLTQLVVAPTRQLAIARAIRYGRSLAEEATKLGLSVADKSRVVSNAPSIARDVSAALRGASVAIDSARTAEDLGISTAGGRRRCIGSFAKRLARASRRSRRVRRLANANGGAQRLYKTGTDPQQSYEETVHGAAPQQVATMRKNARMCVTPAGAQSCTTTLLAWRLGPRSDPAVTAPTRQVKLWQRLWRSSPPSEKRQIAKAWKRAHPRILLHGVKWGCVSGPLQATVAALGQLGWAPVSPNKWLAPGKDKMADLDDTAPNAAVQIAAAVEDSAAEAAWRAAASHHLGGGLEEGEPSLQPAMEVRRRFVGERKPTLVKALDAVVCGGLWHSGRGNIATTCRCGKPDDAFHHYWGCELLSRMAEEEECGVIARTQWLKDVFEGETRRYECLWGRAIIPRSLCFPGPVQGPEEVTQYQSCGFTRVVQECRRVYTDGSGGPNYAPKGAPAAGSGMAAIAWEGNLDEAQPRVREVAIACSAVPGRQTVPRAELWAATLAGRAGDGDQEDGAEDGGASIGLPDDIEIRADAAYVVNGSATPTARSRMERGFNGDLWTALNADGAARKRSTLITKVKAHRSPREMLSGQHSICDFIGNHLADASAGAAAEQALQQNEAARVVERWEQRARLVAHRLAAIEAWHWANSDTMLYPKPPQLPPWRPADIYDARQQLYLQVVQRGHVLRVENGRTVCGRCHKRRGRDNSRFWTETDCQPLSIGTKVRYQRGGAWKRPAEDVSAEPRGTAVDRTPSVGLQPPSLVVAMCAETGANVGGTATLGYDITSSTTGSSSSTSPWHPPVAGPTFLPGLAATAGPAAAQPAPAMASRSPADADDGSNTEVLNAGSHLGDPTSQQDAFSDEDVFHFGGDLDQPWQQADADHDAGETPEGGHKRPTSEDPFSQSIKRARCDSGPPPAAAVLATTSTAGHATDGARRRIVGKRSAASAGLTPPPASGLARDRDDSAGQEDLVTRRERRRLVLEQQAEVRRRQRADADALREAWGSASTAVSVAAYLSIQPTEDAPPFPVGDGHDLLACGGFHACVRCGAVVGWHGHSRLALACRGFCPPGSRRPVRLLASGRLPHRQLEHYGRDWPSGEVTPTPYRLRLSQSRP